MRTLASALLVAIALLGALAGWFRSGWRAAGAEARARIEAPRRDAADAAGQLADDLAARIEDTLEREGERPYYHYQNLFHDPRGAHEGNSVIPSPLSLGPEDALVENHFQIDAAGHVSSPRLNDDVPELNPGVGRAREESRLAELRGVVGELRPERLGDGASSGAIVASVTPETQAAARAPARAKDPPEVKGAKVVEGRPVKRPALGGGDKKPRKTKPVEAVQRQVQSFDPAAYAQNTWSNEVYQDIVQRGTPGSASPRMPSQAAGPSQAQLAPPAQLAPQAPSPARLPPTPRRAKPRSVRPAPPARPPAVEVTTENLRLRTVTLAGAPRLVAVRRVDTPDGPLVQGFVLDDAALRTWLAERRAAVLPVELAPLDAPARPEVAVAEVPLAGARWAVWADAGPAVAAARAAAPALRRHFLGEFLPGAALASLAGAAVVLLVARTERLARERSRFAAAAAHELRTPLAGLVLYGEMLEAGLGDPAKTSRYAARIADEAGRLGRVVGNVLGFTQLERGRLGVRVAAGCLGQAVRAAALRARPPLEHAGVTLDVDAPETLPARFDDDAVARVLQNLLDNAEKYSRSAGDRRVEVRVRAAAGRAFVDVIDHGPGVARDARRRLFAPFARGGDPDQPAGLGLGLALARALARAQGGELTHAATPGGGATFTLALTLLTDDLP